MSIGRWVDKEVVVHIHSGILPSYKRNTFMSVLMRRMKLEPIIQSKVSQKEKYQWYILYIYMEFRKMVTMILYAGQRRDTAIKNRFLDSVGVGWFERMALKHVYYHMWNRWSAQVACMKQVTKSQCSGTTQRDRVGREVEGGFRIGEHMCTCGWFMVWQNPP